MKPRRFVLPKSCAVATGIAAKQPPPKDALLRIDQVLLIIPVGRSTWWQGVRDGRFPRGIKLSSRITAWSVADIDALIESMRSAAGVRSAGQGP